MSVRMEYKMWLFDQAMRPKPASEETMNRNEKVNFIESLMTGVMHDVMLAVNSGKLPEEWDGIELRWYIEHRVGETIPIGSKKCKRYKDFMNEVIVRNL